MDIEPTLGLRVQVTLLFPEPPLTVAVNCCVFPTESDTLAGLTRTDTAEVIEMVPGEPVIALALAFAAVPTMLLS